MAKRITPQQLDDFMNANQEVFAMDYQELSYDELAQKYEISYRFIKHLEKRFGLERIDGLSFWIRARHLAEKRNDKLSIFIRERGSSFLHTYPIATDSELQEHFELSQLEISTLAQMLGLQKDKEALRARTSQKLRDAAPQAIEKRKQTMIEKYGQPSVPAELRKPRQPREPKPVDYSQKGLLSHKPTILPVHPEIIASEQAPTLRGKLIQLYEEGTEFLAKLKHILDSM